MDLPDTIHLEESALDDVVVDIGGCGLEEDAKGGSKDVDGGGQDQDAENKGADGVDDVPLGFKIDYDGSDEDTQRLDEVSNYVDEGGLDIDVLFLSSSVSVLLIFMPHIVSSMGVPMALPTAMAVSVPPAPRASPMTMPMLVQSGTHHCVHCHSEARGEQHGLGVDLKVLVDHPTDDGDQQSRLGWLPENGEVH